jgi:hypothetical protein
VLKLCFELLPQLHAISPNLAEPHVFENLMLQKLAESTANALADFGSRRKHCLNLRRIVVSGHVPHSVDMPQLSEMCMYNVSRGDVIEICEPQLTALHIRAPCKVQLDRLLYNCPNLSELSLHATGVSAASELRPNTLQRLRFLRVSFSDYHVFYDSQKLVELLRLAPQLRSVNITVQFLYDGLFEDLALLSQKRTCFRHLEELKYVVKTFDNTDIYEFDVDLIKEAIDTCILNCDQLKTIQFEFLTVDDNGNVLINAA